MILNILPFFAVLFQISKKMQKKMKKFFLKQKCNIGAYDCVLDPLLWVFRFIVCFTVLY